MTIRDTVNRHRHVQIRYLDGLRLRRAVLAGAEWVIRKQAYLDDINVFPVPDGDTGTNMASTMRSVMDRLGLLFAPGIGMVIDGIADSALMGARGNSGAILAQFFQGMAESMRGHFRVTTDHFAEAVSQGATWAREAISDPREGTILTVIQEWANHIREMAPTRTDFADLLRTSMKAAQSSLKETPEKLAVLKKAGVVDAGAQGFVYLLEGIIEFIEGGRIDRHFETEIEGTFGHKADVAHNVEEITFRYCTECLLEGKGLNRTEISHELAGLGDSLIVAGSRRKIRVHIHTNEPRDVFDVLESYGSVSLRKADDMIQQHTDVYSSDLKDIALVVDSGCDIPADQIAENNVHVVPLQLQFGTKTYIDGISIDAETFSELLQTDPHHPKTSQPSPADFERTYTQVVKHYKQAISLHIPDKLSGTMQSARRAAGRYADKIFLVDCKSVSIGMGLIAQTAIREIDAGEEIDSIIMKIENDIEHLRTYISLPTMDFLVKGGRVGTAKGLIGKFLKVKPVLAFQPDGTIDVVDKAVRNQNVHEKTLEIITQEIGERKGLRMAVGHFRAPEIADWYAERIRNLFQPRELMIQEISPVLAVHGGPGVAGIAYILEE